MKKPGKNLKKEVMTMKTTTMKMTTTARKAPKKETKPKLVKVTGMLAREAVMIMRMTKKTKHLPPKERTSESEPPIFCKLKLKVNA